MSKTTIINGSIGSDTHINIIDEDQSREELESSKRQLINIKERKKKLSQEVNKNMYNSP